MGLVIMFNRLIPYNDLPLLPPQEELETKTVLKQAISANRVLANLRGLAALTLSVISKPLNSTFAKHQEQHSKTQQVKLFTRHPKGKA